MLKINSESLVRLLTTITGEGTFTVHLYTNAVAINLENTIADFDLADFDGYSPVDLVWEESSFADPQGIIYSEPAVFMAEETLSVPQSCKGYLVLWPDGELFFAEKIGSGINFSVPGQTHKVRVQLRTKNYG